MPVVVGRFVNITNGIINLSSILNIDKEIEELINLNVFILSDEKEY